MARKSASLVVFSDLDGTLLDHHTYSHREATPALEALEARGIPLIAATSKTASELRALSPLLGNAHPSIAENGGIVSVPAGYFAEAADSGEHRLADVGYAEIRRVLLELRRTEAFEFRGFGDMTIAEVAACTGLGDDDAARARERATSEPIRWLDDDDALRRFTAALTLAGLRVQPGGRFLSVQSTVDKADGVRWLTERYTREAGGRRPFTVALGDSANDVGMLEAVDLAVAMLAADGSRPEPSCSRQPILPSEPGPKGFRAAIDRVLRELEQSER